MRRTSVLTCLMLFVFASASKPLQAQEPAFFSDIQAVRFEQNPGYFHYLYPCKTIAEFQAQMPKPDPLATGLEPAICWPVNALRMVKVDGKFESSPFIPGQLVISEHNIRFFPNDNKLSDHYANFKPAEARFEHEAGKNFAFFGSTDLFYKFAFSTICLSCAQGTSVPTTSNPAQLETEFGLVNASFKQFGIVLKRVQSLAAQIRIEIGAKNQPGLGDPPEAMGLYASLNTSLTELCPEPAKSCIQSFIRYQTECKSLAQVSDCHQPPSCTAACNLSAENMHRLPAMFCIQADQQSATPIPDWSDAIRKKNTPEPHMTEADPPAAQSSGQMVQMTAAQLPIRPFRPGALDPQFAVTLSSAPSVGCSVKASYLRASTPAFGVAGMSMGAAGGVIGSIFGNDAPRPQVNPGAPRKIAISAGVATGLLIQQVRPVYPPIAKAARVSGTVVLQATISKEGTIENLHVISGPPLLQSAALDAVSQWRYTPYRLIGQPVEVDTTINVVFNLDGPAAPATPGAQVPPQR